MKKILLLSLIVVLSEVGHTCSCFPPEPNFYKNLSENLQIGLAVFDTMDYNYQFQDVQSQTGYFILLDTIGHFQAYPGDTIVVLGQDGFNCSEVLTDFARGDTMFLALGTGFYETFERDTFDLEGACGPHYLEITNGQHAGLTISEIEIKIKKLLNHPEEPCICGSHLDYWDFYTQVSEDNYHCMVVFNGFDYAYEYNGLSSQTGYFTLLDTIGDFNTPIGDTLVIIGEDGINCGEMLNRFSYGDTLFLSLSDGYYESFEKDTFYLKGGACGVHFLRILNGQHNGLTIEEIKQKIRANITGINETFASRKISIFPNPAEDYLIVQSAEEPISFIQIYDVSGRMVKWVSKTDAPSINVSLIGLKPGVYNIAIQTYSGTVLYKFIKKG